MASALTPAENRPLEQLEVPVIESLSRVARAPIEAFPVHPLDHPALGLDDDGRRS